MLKALFTSTRFWAGLVPLLALFAKAFGLPMTEDMLNTGGSQAVAFGTTILSWWSMIKANPISTAGVLGALMQRRTLALAIPLVVTIGQAAGLGITEEALTSASDQLIRAVQEILLAVSLARGTGSGTATVRAAVAGQP